MKTDTVTKFHRPASAVQLPPDDPLTALLAFYDFPATHWQHIRTTNPIESSFATVRLRTAKTRGCVSRATILAMVFKMGISAQHGWRRLRGFDHLAKVVQGVRFKNGREVVQRDQRKNAKGTDS